MEKVKGEINYVFWFIAVLGIISNISNVVSSVASFLTPETFDWNGQTVYLSSHLASGLSIIGSLLIIISLILTLNKRRLGIYGFTAVVFVFSIISLAFYEDRLKQLPYNIGVALIQYALFFGLLMIKRNGVRSWNLFFPRKSEVPKLYKEDIEEPQKPQEDDIAELQESQVSPIVYEDPKSNFKPIENSTSEQHVTNVENTVETEVSDDDSPLESNPKDKRLRMNINHKKTALILIVTIIVVLGAIFSTYYIRRNNNPDYQYAKADSLFKHGQIDDAISIYTKLANDKNYVKAKTRLGILYTDNDSVKPNYKLGIKYLTEASSIDSLAMLYLMGIYNSEICNGKFSDKSKVEQLAKRAIGKKWLLGRAYFLLGDLSAERQDYDLAFYNWDKSMSYGYGKAYDNIGWLYYNGNGCKQDDIKAKAYFEKGLQLDKDDDYALYCLGLMYRYGYGVEANLARAYKYLIKSADLGNEDAKKEVADIKMNESAVKLLGL